LETHIPNGCLTVWLSPLTKWCWSLDVMCWTIITEIKTKIVYQNKTCIFESLYYTLTANVKNVGIDTQFVF
jgi:hypothetical protein